MVSKKSRNKAMGAIRRYYDKYPNERTVDAFFLRKSCGFDEDFAEQVIRVLENSNLITYVPDPGDKSPCIRLTPEGWVYAELQADIRAARRASFWQFTISTVISIVALLLSLLDLLGGLPW